VIEIKFIIQDDEDEMISVEHDGRVVWEDNAPDAWPQYFRHFMPRHVPVLLTTDAAEQEAREDPRPYPYGQGNDARLMRWLTDNGADPRIREEDEDGATEVAQVTMSGAELHWLLFQAVERFYWYGADDVRERYGLR
jgi:hypothetical protein